MSIREREPGSGLGADSSLLVALLLIVTAAGAFWLDLISPGRVAWPRIDVTAVLPPAAPVRAPAGTVPTPRSSMPPAARAFLPAAWLDRSPTRDPFEMDIYRRGTFVSQIDKLHCMSAAMQNMLNLVGPDVDLTAATQRRIAAVSLPLSTDTIGGGQGPEGWAAGLGRLGAGRYEVRVYATRAAALRDAVLALRITGRPVGILAWWGAHSWVLTGFEADADPLVFRDFEVSGYRIVDPWYPRTSTIWGRSKPPDELHSPDDMVHNLPAWKRPEGRYPDRDGKWVMVVPIGADAAAQRSAIAG